MMGMYITWHYRGLDDAVKIELLHKDKRYTSDEMLELIKELMAVRDRLRAGQ